MTKIRRPLMLVDNKTIENQRNSESYYCVFTKNTNINILHEAQPQFCRASTESAVHNTQGKYHTTKLFSSFPRDCRDVGFRILTFCFILTQQFSIGFRSGEFPDHGCMTWICFLESQTLITRDEWQGAPSCWKWEQLWIVMKFGTFSFKIVRYAAELSVVFPGTNHKPALP